ncbi:SapC family protein [Chromohalobacter salexigens]|nr:SapC family protein [Chromohalobacter salexigens]
MPNPLVISPKECRGLTWHPPIDLSFAAETVSIPLHAGEMAKAAASMPLALVKEGRKWQLVGVCGLEPGHNLFIKQGQWLGHYRPQWLSTWPFAVTQVGEKSLVTFERDSGLLGDEEGEPFFDTEDQPSGRTAEVIATLKANHGKRQRTREALAALQRAGVIAPWPETLQRQLGMAVPGLHMVDERALAELDDEAFLALRKAQALPIAYAVNLSLAQSHLLTRLARVNPAQAEAPENLDSFFGDDEELTFDFDN